MPQQSGDHLRVRDELVRGTAHESERANGIIIVTWDESAPTDTSGCCGGVATGGHIPTIVITSKNKGLGQFAGIGDHYGTLAAIEQAFGVTRLLNSANSINGNLSGAFG